MAVDYHVHTAFSDDSVYPMEQVVLDAISMGLRELCFTDHVDYGVKKDHDDPEGMLYRRGGPGEPEQMPLANVDYPAYYEQFCMLREKYQSRITLKLGLEFGMQRHTIELYEKLFCKYPFDFIILSVHEIDNLEFWNQAFQEGKTQEEYITRYYEEILYLVRNFQHYSVLGHLDLITRYDRCGIYPFAKLEPVISEILKTVIANGKGIEVNTSCYRYGLKDLTPSRDILMLYRKLGGRILTVGSDSHKQEHLGSHICEAMQQLTNLGFTEYCTFDRMQPSFHQL